MVTSRVEMPTWDELTKEQRLRIVRLLNGPWSYVESAYNEMRKIIIEMKP